MIHTGISKVKATNTYVLILDTFKYNTVPNDINEVKSRDIHDHIY